MNGAYTAYWEECWKAEDKDVLFQYLNGYIQEDDAVWSLFHENHVKTVCDAACGFGAYTNDSFDAAIAYSVLDHLTVDDAKAALQELSGIVRTGGFISVSFDIPEEDDFTTPHIVTKDGSFIYTEGNLQNMLYHPYDANEIHSLLEGQDIVLEVEKRNKRVCVVKNSSHI